jgi:hypothetical protein
MVPQMNKLIIAFVALVAFQNVAKAETTYIDVIRTCGAEWRESDAKATPKVKALRRGISIASIVWRRKGYVTKAARKADFVRFPTKIELG